MYMCVYMCVCVLRARGAEFGGFAGGGFRGCLGGSWVNQCCWQVDGRILQKFFLLFKSRCPSILSVKGVYADVEEFVAIRDWVSIVSTM